MVSTLRCLALKDAIKKNRYRHKADISIVIGMATKEVKRAQTPISRDSSEEVILAGRIKKLVIRNCTTGQGRTANNYCTGGRFSQDYLARKAT